MSRKKTGSRSNHARGGGGKGDVAYVSVFCVGPADAPHEKFRIASFIPEEDASAVVWHAAPGTYFDPSHPTTIPISGRVSQWLDGNRWVSRGTGEHNRAVFDSESFRVRWNLACDRCSARRVVRTPADLYPAFTALAVAGIQEVELVHLIHARHAD